MQDKVYFLRLDVDYGREDLYEEALQHLDRERVQKIQKLHQEGSRWACLGAGLLLQMAVVERELPAAFFQSMDVCEAVQRLKGQPVQELSLMYGPEGKPMLRDGSMEFNISHSGDCVILAASDRPVGVDIQAIPEGEAKRERLYKTLNRFLPSKQLEAINCMEDETEKIREAVALWTRWEAYGKLTGMGIFKALEEKNIPMELLEWEFLTVPEGYCATVCRYKI